jgi:hypothetical protein
VREKDVVINGTNGFPLLPGHLVRVKVTPLILCTTHLRLVKTEGRPTTIVIVTGEDILFFLYIAGCRN